MRMRRIERMLWVALVAACLLHLVAWSDPLHRNAKFLPDMVAAVPYESQSANPVFADGKTMQLPPEGTIARGHAPLRSGDVLLDLATPWEQLPPEQRDAWDRFAPPPDEAAPGDADPAAEGARSRRSEQLFVTFCSPCHGMGGVGDGTVTRRGVPAPPSLLDDNARGLSDGRMFRIVTAGRGNMPAYATQIEREDRWKALRWVRTLQAR